jgi:deoxyribodipyrimidine photolyase-related protein
MNVPSHPPCRHLILILGDQLDVESSVFKDIDPAQDMVVMIEAFEESTHVWSHKARTTLFLSAMRHFAREIEGRGFRVAYRSLEVEGDATLAAGLTAVIGQYQPQRVMGVEPGDRRVRASLELAIKNIAACARPDWLSELNDSIIWLEDQHFLCSPAHFRQWAGQSASLRMEFFYRMLRRQYRVLMDGDQPIGGKWNFDSENRKGFGKAGPQALPQAPTFEPDALTREVMAVVEKHFGDHPGDLAHFNWPVTRAEARHALADFIEHRLADFGTHQDAMWTDMPFGWHALLSSSLNLKLLNPLEVVVAAESAWRERGLELASVEGFIRQILGWREFMRGIYALDMPALKQANHFDHQNALPAWYWSGDTQMNCMRQCIKQTLAHGYSHHIQRLMVTGMFGVTAQISPQALCDWYLAVYVDAVEWVELPNTAGMALYAAGGRFTSKPYVASGAYVKRMSNYCGACRYRPEERTGPNACPVTTLYWNFLDQNEAELAGNARTGLMVKNLQRLSPAEREAIRQRADAMLLSLDSL